MSRSQTPRALGDVVWGRRVARLPGEGVLLVATDLQGNLRDYQAMIGRYEQEEAAGNRPVLAFCGDLVHGPHPSLLEPGSWPEYLGEPYPDQSAELIRDFERFTRHARAMSVLGNHEHAHIGGPVVAKFHPDEAAVLNAALGPAKPSILAFMGSFPLLAVSPSGIVLTHGAPAATAPDLAAFEAVAYRAPGSDRIGHEDGLLGALLWARAATPAQARAFLAATSLDGRPQSFVAYGHDIAWAGYEIIGDEQICVSTSYGLRDPFKVYLRLDLARRYASARDLTEGVEILPLYPD
jgi:hypothetical protein